MNFRDIFRFFMYAFSGKKPHKIYHEISIPECIPDIRMKKNPNEPMSGGRWVELNCPNCGILCYVGTVHYNETKEFHCEAGEASCGWIWTETFNFGNIHDYDIENYRNGMWGKTNWGGNNKGEVTLRACEVVKSSIESKSHIGKITHGVRVVDRENNILYKWMRNESKTFGRDFMT